MAPSNRQSETSLKDQLYKEPYLFEFHKAVQILELLDLYKLPLGKGVDAENEAVKIKSRVHFDSLRSDIYSLEETESQTPVMNVNFMGIAGVQGPLPFPYSEVIVQRKRAGDASLQDFLDIFNHRLASILHLARKQSTVSLYSQTPDKTPHAAALRAFLGIAQKSTQDRMAVPDRGFMQFAGAIWRQPHSREGLARMLSIYFKVPVKIEECVGQRLPIDPEHQTRIGTSGQWQVLGQTAALGAAVWDYQSHFRVVLGPLDAMKFQDFLPSGTLFKELVDFTAFCAPPQMTFEIELQIKKNDTIALKLDDQHQLGWRSWLGKSTLNESDEDLRVRLKP